MNTLDIIILVILVIFIIRGLFRGLIQEVLSLIAVLLAVYLAAHYQHLLVPYLEPYITTEILVTWLAYGLLFIATLVVFWLLTKLLQAALSISMLGWVDRTTGGVFGLLEGVLISLIVLMFVQSFAPRSEWLTESYIAPRARHLVELVGSLAPESLRQRLHLPPAKEVVDETREAIGFEDDKPQQ